MSEVIKQLGGWNKGNPLSFLEDKTYRKHPLPFKVFGLLESKEKW